jgi:hypothetical protein
MNTFTYLDIVIKKSTYQGTLDLYPPITGVPSLCFLEENAIAMIK